MHVRCTSFVDLVCVCMSGARLLLTLCACVHVRCTSFVDLVCACQVHAGDDPDPLCVYRAPQDACQPESNAAGGEVHHTDSGASQGGQSSF